MPIRSSLATLCALLAGLSGSAHAQLTTPAPGASVQLAPDPAAPRPKIALVLSGGGARGFSHIGVLRVLRELRIPIDMVVGTSMGAVVGGSFAAGRTVEELEQIVRATSWDRVLADRPARDDLDFRLKEEDLLLPSRIEFGVSRSGLSLPPAAAGNAGLEFALAKLLPSAMHDKPVNQLALPFRATAADLLTGDLVELSDSSLFLAIRASLSLPGVFSPVRVNKRLVVDGGLVRNLPVDLARRMGADVIIAVNVGTPLAGENELGSAIGVANQMLQILTEQNVQRSIKELGPNDVLISPDLTGISFLDFRSYERTMRAGEAAARALVAPLTGLSLPPAQYAALEAHRLAPSPSQRALPLAKLEVRGTQHINPQALIAQSDLEPGKPVSTDQVRQAAIRLYGRGDLDYVATDTKEVDGQNEVTLRVHEAGWGRNRLRVGLELASDFSNNNAFSFGMMNVATSLNNWGAELRTVARIGSKRLFGMQFWQPLGPGSDWYLAPAVQYGAGSEDLFAQGRRMARLGLDSSSVSLIGGRQLGNWGDIQVGAARSLQHARTLIPDDPAVFPNARAINTQQWLQARVDTLDSLAFPTRGNLLIARWDRLPAAQPSQPVGSLTTLTGLWAFPVGGWAGHIDAEFAHANHAGAAATLGGFLTLSGAPEASIYGEKVIFGRVVLAHRIGDMPTALGGTIRAGFSLEMGGAFGAQEKLRLGGFKQAASGFLSVDTRFGPAYLGAGVTRGMGNSLYLFLGPIW